LVFIANSGDFGAGFDDFVAQRFGATAKLTICGKQFCLFKFQQSFRCQSRATFFCQFICD